MNFIGTNIIIIFSKEKQRKTRAPCMDGDPTEILKCMKLKSSINFNNNRGNKAREQEVEAKWRDSARLSMGMQGPGK